MLHIEMYRLSTFFVWRQDLFVLRDVYLQRVHPQEGSLPRLLSAIELSAWPLLIRTDSERLTL